VIRTIAAFAFVVLALAPAAAAAGRLPTRRSELADLEIALLGWSSPGGQSDLVFPIADNPFPGPPPAVVRTTPRKEGPRTSAAFAIGGVLLAFGAAAVAVRRIRR
jgi:hypothetical protein